MRRSRGQKNERRYCDNRADMPRNLCLRAGYDASRVGGLEMSAAERFFRRFNRIMEDERTLIAIGLLVIAWALW